MNINKFKYEWRFTDKKFEEFSDAELSQIRVINSGKARTEWDKIVDSEIFGRSSFIQDITARTAPVFINDCGWGDNKIENRTKHIICEYFKKNSIVNITLLYDKSTALETAGALFWDRWSDFCYPNDSIIISFGSDFMIYYEDILYGIYFK